MKFAKGTSGNPNGRPPGNTLSGRLRAAIEKDFDEIVAAITAQAKAGDMQAANLLLSRVAPALRQVQEPTPVPVTGNTLSDKAASIIDLISRGELSVADGKDLLAGLGAVSKIIETDDLIKRIEALEGKQL